MSIVDLIKSKEDLIIYAPAEPNLVFQAEQELKVVFSKEYVEYVLAFGIAVFAGHELTGICDRKRLDVVRNTFNQRELNLFIPKDWYVIETLDIDGVVIWQDGSGKIYQTVPGGRRILIADSLREYIAE